MLRELIVRFVLGGVIVSAFAALGEGFTPKTFAGLFGAAPSVALVSLAIAYEEHGSDYVRSEALPMLIGSVAFFVYAAACVAGGRRRTLPVWLAATTSWAAWFVVAFALSGLSTRVEALR
jgi:uncharacterized membrane protein (GlpM family)